MYYFEISIILKKQITQHLLWMISG